MTIDVELAVTDRIVVVRFDTFWHTKVILLADTKHRYLNRVPLIRYFAIAQFLEYLRNEIFAIISGNSSLGL